METKLGAGQCLASALLDVSWGQRENASSIAAAQRPQSGASGDGRAAPTRARLSPCLCHSTCATAPVPLALHCPAPSPSQASLQGQKKALSVKPREPKDVNAPLESGDASLFTSRVTWGRSGLARDRGCGEARGGRGNAAGTQFHLSGCTTLERPSSVLLGKLRQCSEGEMLQGSSSSWLLRSRLLGPELGAVATKKVHFGFNLIKRINNYQLSQFGLTTIPSAEVPS